MEVGTESSIDRSKSIKSHLMRLFKDTNTNIQVLASRAGDTRAFMAAHACSLPQALATVVMDCVKTPHARCGYSLDRIANSFLVR